jgi:hypothetical protein
MVIIVDWNGEVRKHRSKWTMLQLDLMNKFWKHMAENVDYGK